MMHLCSFLFVILKSKFTLYLFLQFYCYYLHLQTMSAKPFTVTYTNFRKVVQCKEYANIYDDVALKYSNYPIFPRRIKLQYEDKEVNDFIDLDSPIQLDKRKSNKINVLEKETRYTDSMSRSFFNTVLFQNFFRTFFLAVNNKKVLRLTKDYFSIK